MNSKLRSCPTCSILSWDVLCKQCKTKTTTAWGGFIKIFDYENSYIPSFYTGLEEDKSFSL